MEFAGKGDLSGYVKKNKALKEELACLWFTQTSEAVHYLHNEARMVNADRNCLDCNRDLIFFFHRPTET